MKAILFDLDGTLVDSEGIHFKCWNKLLERYGIAIAADRYMQNFAGVSLRENSEKIHQLFSTTETPEDMMTRRQAILLEHLRREQPVMMPHAVETVTFFHQLGLPLALVTSASKDEVDIVLPKTGLHHFFQLVITRDDVTRFKPHPEGYQLAINQLKKLPGECIVLEDSLSGVRAASLSGAITFAIGPQLLTGADRCFPDLQAAKNYIVQYLL